MTLYAILMTVLLLVTFYFGFRTKWMKSYSDSYIGMEEYYLIERRKLAFSVAGTTIIGVIGYIILSLL